MTEAWVLILELLWHLRLEIKQIMVILGLVFKEF